MRRKLCQDNLRIGSVEFDPTNGAIMDGDVRSVLPVLQARLLLALAEAGGRVVSREDLSARLWPNTIVEYEQSLNTAIKELRQALGDDARAPRFIETVPKRGYCLLPKVVRNRSRLPRIIENRKTLAAASVAAVIIATGSLALTRGGYESSAPIRLAVWPALASNGELLTGLLADIDDDIRREVTHASGNNLAVLGPAVSDALSASEISLADSGANLQLVITADMNGPLHTATAVVSDAVRERWSFVYEGLVIADEVDAALFARRVANDLVGAFVDESLDAHAVAQLSLDDRRTLIEAEFLASNGDPAVAIESLAPMAARIENSDVWLALARAQRKVAQTDGVAPGLAKQSLERALSIDPLHVNAALELGDIAFYDEAKWRVALKWYRRGASRAEFRGDAHYKLAWCLSALGRHEEAIRHAEGALVLDPVSSQLLGDTSWIYFFARHYDRAIAIATKSLQYDADNASSLSCLLQAYSRIGDFESAVAIATRLLRTTIADPAVLEQSGLMDPDAREAYERFHYWLANSANTKAPAGMRAVNFAQIGETERACQLLEDAMAQRQYWALISLAVDPRFDAIRDDPRFQEILGKLRRL